MYIYMYVTQLDLFLYNKNRCLPFNCSLFGHFVLEAKVSKKLNDRSSWIPSFIDFLYNITKWQIIKCRAFHQNYSQEKSIYGHMYCLLIFYLFFPCYYLIPFFLYRTAVKDRIVGLLLFMGKLMIVGIITFIAYLGFAQYEEQGRVIWQRELNYYLIPLIVSLLTWL